MAADVGDSRLARPFGKEQDWLLQAVSSMKESNE